MGWDFVFDVLEVGRGIFFPFFLFFLFKVW